MWFFLKRRIFSCSISSNYEKMAKYHYFTKSIEVLIKPEFVYSRQFRQLFFFPLLKYLLLLPYYQWRNEFEWRPTVKFKWRPYKVQKFYCLQKKKKVATFFVLPIFFPPPNVNLAPLIAILAPPEAFCTAKFFPHH